jgi:flagellin
MSMVIGTNVASITAQRHLSTSRSEMETSMERLASGKRINSAMDDAAGLALANRLEGKVMGLNQGVRNANDGISMLQTAEGALEQTSDILNRMKTLATQAKSGTYSSTDRTSMNVEFQALSAELTRIADNTDFNGTKLLDAATTVTYQVGDAIGDTIAITLEAMDAADLALSSSGVAVETAAQAITIENGAALKQTGTFTSVAIGTGTYFEMAVNGTTFKQTFTTDAATTMILMADKINAGTTNLSAVGTSSTVLTLASTVNAAGWTATEMTQFTPGATTTDLTTAANASSSITALDSAINTVDAYRGKLGATANRLEHTVSNLMNRVEHQSAAKSQIEDADFAIESANLAKSQVLQQAGTAMLAQANASGQGVLSLLK